MSTASKPVGCVGNPRSSALSKGCSECFVAAILIGRLFHEDRGRRPRRTHRWPSAYAIIVLIAVITTVMAAPLRKFCVVRAGAEVAEAAVGLVPGTPTEVPA
jgi:hypothetical protein